MLGLCNAASAVGILSFLLPRVVAQYPQTNGRFIHDNSLGELYPYTVSLPANQAQTLAPTILSIAGKGSAFQEGLTFPLDSTVSYGCAGWRASRYMNGSRDEADVIVGEQFITITPYVHVYEADANGEYNLTVEGLMAVINDARTKYPIDPARIYIQGYSAGARAIWSVLPAQPNYFAAATISAGVPQPVNFTGLPDMLNVPLRIYTGTADYDAFSQAWMAEAYQNQIQSLGGSMSSIVYMQGVDHNDMQQTPYNADMFYWLLNHTNPNVPAAQASAALTPNPSASAVYSSILSYEFAYESVYSASLYNDGLPPASRINVPAPSTTLAPLSLASASINTETTMTTGTQAPAISVVNQAAQQSSATSTKTARALILTLCGILGWLAL